MLTYLLSTSRLKASQWFSQEPGEAELVKHAFALDGGYPYTPSMLLLPDAVPRWERPERFREYLQ